MTSLAIRVLQRFSLALSPPAARRFGTVLGLLGFHVVRFRRRMVERAIRGALGLDRGDPMIRRLARANFVHYGLLVVEILRLRRIIEGELEREVRFVGMEHLEMARAQGKGVLALTAHLGNYDLLAVAVTCAGYPVSFISKRVKNKHIERFWMAERAAAGLRIFTRGDSPRELLKTLKNNEILGVILDQHAHANGVWVEFFGRPAKTLNVLANLARASGAAVVPMFSRRLDDGTHLIEVLPAVPFEERGSREETVEHNTQRYTAVIEQAVRANPEQWTWIHKRWKPQPPTAGSSPTA